MSETPMPTTPNDYDKRAREILETHLGMGVAWVSLEERIATALREQAEATREECAKIAENVADKHAPRVQKSDIAWAMHTAAHEIVEAITSPSPPSDQK
jgi:hypothetical protein